MTIQIEETRKNIISSLYTSKRAQAHLKFYEEFASNWKNQSLDVYMYYNIEIPKLVLSGYNSTNKAKAKEFNKFAPKNDEILEVHHQRSKDFINHRFELTFEHWCYPINPITKEKETPSLECMEVRLNKIGLKIDLDALVTKAINQIRTDETSNKDIITNIKKFFSTIIHSSSYPAEVQPIIDNHQFALAWNHILKHNLVTIDQQFVTISLMSKILNTTYTIEHKTFSQFYTTFVNNCAMYLFSEWYTHFTYNQIREICDTMTTAEFANNYSEKIQEHGLTIPPIVQLPCRQNLIYKAVQNTHLKTTVEIYKSSQPDPNQLQPLIQALRDGDFRTSTKSFPKTTSETSSRCAMCAFIKTELHISNIKLHTSDNPCPSENKTILANVFNNLRQDKNRRSSNPPQRNPNPTNPYNPSRQLDNFHHQPHQPTQPSLSSRSTVVSNPSTSSNFQPLPNNFDELNECAHCYRSGNANPPGMHSATRKAIYQNHNSRSCKYNYYKNNRASNDSENPYTQHVANNATSSSVNPFSYDSDHSEDRSTRKRNRESRSWSPDPSPRSRPPTPY